MTVGRVCETDGSIDRHSYPSSPVGQASVIPPADARVNARSPGRHWETWKHKGKRSGKKPQREYVPVTRYAESALKAQSQTHRWWP